MTRNNKQNGKTGLLQNLLGQGGLPEIFLGPLGPALLNLLAKSADIPAAWLENKAEIIRNTPRNGGGKTASGVPAEALPWNEVNKIGQQQKHENRLTKLISRASEAEKEDLFFRILVLEIRKPNSIAEQDLQQLASLNAEKTEIIADILPLIRRAEANQTPIKTEERRSVLAYGAAAASRAKDGLDSAAATLKKLLPAKKPRR